MPSEILCWGAIQFNLAKRMLVATGLSGLVLLISSLFVSYLLGCLRVG